jgi:DNA polymerase I
MEIELHPAVSLQEDTFNVLIAPVEMLVDAINSNLNLQRYKVLFVSGNYSRILSKLNRNVTELDVRRAFTSFQLMTILEENHHSFLIVEHDPLLYEDAAEMVEYVAQHLRQTSREATVVLYSSAMDSHLEKMTQLADRVFCFYEMPKVPAKGRTKPMKCPDHSYPGGVLMRLSLIFLGKISCAVKEHMPCFYGSTVTP